MYLVVTTGGSNPGTYSAYESLSAAQQKFQKLSATHASHPEMRFQIMHTTKHSIETLKTSESTES